MKSERHFSAGGVIFRKSGKGVRVALISREGGKIWCLPKGHIGAGESAEEAALREVREETGLRGKVVQKLGDIHYQFVGPGEVAQRTKIFKRVSFFLLNCLGGSTREHDFEVDEARWFPIEQAIRKVSYSSERKLLQMAQRRLT